MANVQSTLAVTQRYPALTPTVDNLDPDTPTGSFWFWVGPSGGKSTTLRVPGKPIESGRISIATRMTHGAAGA